MSKIDRAEEKWYFPTNLRRDRFTVSHAEVVPFDIEPGRNLLKTNRHLISISSSGASKLRSIDGGPMRPFELLPASIHYLPGGLTQSTTSAVRSTGVAVLVDEKVLRDVAYETIDPNFLDLRPFEPVANAAAFHAGSLLENIAATGEAQAWSILTEQLVATLCFNVLRELGTEKTPYEGGLPARRLRRVLDYIGDNYSRPIKLSELAHVGALSLYHFSRSFRDSMGVSPVRYLWRFRVEASRRMLQSSAEMSLTHVAIACGFSSQSHFTELFKRETGMTPGAYRMSLKRY